MVGTLYNSVIEDDVFCNNAHKEGHKLILVLISFYSASKMYNYAALGIFIQLTRKRIKTKINNKLSLEIADSIENLFIMSFEEFTCFCKLSVQS